MLAGLLFGVYLFAVIGPVAGTFGFDAFAYWAVDPSNPYQVPVGGLGAFTYTPVAARAFAPAGLLAWPTFLWLWSAILLGTAMWLGGRRFLWVLAFPPVALELWHGNIHLLLAAMTVLGFRYPAFWAFGVFTKATPGIGLLWFLVRREWRNLAIALGVIGVDRHRVVGDRLHSCGRSGSSWRSTPSPGSRWSRRRSPSRSWSACPRRRRW